MQTVYTVPNMIWIFITDRSQTVYTVPNMIWIFASKPHLSRKEQLHYNRVCHFGGRCNGIHMYVWFLGQTKAGHTVHCTVSTVAGLCRYCDYFWDSVATVCGLHIWIKCYVKVASCTWAAYLPLFSRLYKRLVGSVRNQTFVFCPPTNSCLLPIGLFAPVLLCSKFTKMGQQFEAKTYFLQESVRKKSAIIVNTSFV